MCVYIAIVRGRFGGIWAVLQGGVNEAVPRTSDDHALKSDTPMIDAALTPVSDSCKSAITLRSRGKRQNRALCFHVYRLLGLSRFVKRRWIHSWV